jgi:hypothetical protein
MIAGILTVPLMSSGLKVCLKASTMHDSSAYDHRPISGMNRSGAFTSTDGGLYRWPPAIYISSNQRRQQQQQRMLIVNLKAANC